MEWKGSVHIDAPAAEVYRYLADFSQQPDWDHAVAKTEQVAAGDAQGVGAKWRTNERLDSLQSDRNRKPLLRTGSVGVTVREVRELTPNERVAWHAYPIPRMGITADCAFTLTPVDGGTRVEETVQINTLSVMEAVGKFVFRGLDAKQQAQWEANLLNLKHQVERRVGAAVPAAAAV